MSIKFTSKDNNWTDATTIYWFNCDGVEFGVVHSGENDPVVVDRDGATIEECNYQAQSVPRELHENLDSIVTKEMIDA